ncbi:MAG: hypothetical protein ABI351_00050 [Herbaspirillum sp.]
MQRYRCSTYRHTHNNLTGTPLMWLQLKEKWPQYKQVLIDAMTTHDLKNRLG